MLRKGFYLVLVILLLTVAGNWVFFANVNTYQADARSELRLVPRQERL